MLQRIEAVIRKYVGGAMSSAYNGENTTLEADHEIAAYLLRKLKPWVLSPAVREGTTHWLVWDATARLWWKSDGKGYTPRLAEAGRFTEAEALRHQMASDLTAERHDVAIPLAAVRE